MPDIRCPSCGKDNPDFLDVCQFCQTPLTPKSILQIGEKPTKKTTGELEPVLPEWLRDVHQQARDSAEEDAAEAASMPKVQKEEPPDLLAGLASQSARAEEEDVPDWLSSLSSQTEEKPSAPETTPQTRSNIFAQFERGAPASKDETAAEDTSWSSGTVEEPSGLTEGDELSEWLTQASSQPAEPFTLDDEARPVPPQESTPQPPQEEEDLSWLRSLEEEAKKTGELSRPKQDQGWPSEVDPAPAQAGSSDQDDLSWLNQLGALPPSEHPVPPPAGQQEDLSWLNDVGDSPVSDEPGQQPSQPKEDLDWMRPFAENSESPQPEAAPPASKEDLSWLSELGSTSEQVAQKPEETAAEDLSWLTSLQGSSEASSAGPFTDAPVETDQPEEEPPALPHVSPFTPRRTAPLQEVSGESIPEWLKSATEEPSMPLGPKALDQFREDFKIPTEPEEPFSWKSFVPGIEPAEEGPPPPRPQSPLVDEGLLPPESSKPALSNQEVDSLFSVDMPDWLSRSEPAEGEPPAEEIGIHAEGGEALSPADLPSWVQAMRPVEAVISETVPSVEDQPAEREGPLAGFRGIIPAAPIGSSRRPQPLALKLQATDEQQAGAELLEQILLGETTPRPLVSTPVVISQRMLRWAIAALVLIVLSTVILLRTQILPVTAPVTGDVSDVVLGISEDAPLLVILDYQPGLAGEMEAVSGPLLDQLVMQRHPHISFIATSPNGAALVERLLASTNINQPGGYGYVSGQNYVNMGYLPGGEAGVLAFLNSPQTAIPDSPVLGFPEYAAVILLTDQADSARVWVEQLHILKQADPALSGQPLLAVSSAQAGPMLQPYVISGQINGLISGLSEAARYEFVNDSRPGTARSYWDAFGIGLMMAVGLIVLGGLWSAFTGLRARRAEASEE